MFLLKPTTTVCFIYSNFFLVNSLILKSQRNILPYKFDYFIVPQSLRIILNITTVETALNIKLAYKIYVIIRTKKKKKQ